VFLSVLSGVVLWGTPLAFCFSLLPHKISDSSHWWKKQNEKHNNNNNNNNNNNKIYRSFISCLRTTSHSNLSCVFYKHSIPQLVLLKTIFSSHLSLGLERCLFPLLFATSILINFLASMLRLSRRTNYYLLRVSCFWQGFATCFTS